jgi:hypothetical protein
MMFMITIPPTPSDEQGQDEGGGRDLAPQRGQALGGDHAERIGTLVGRVAQGAQEGAHLVHGGVDPGHPASRLDEDVEGVAAPELPAEGLDGDEHLAVALFAQHAPLLLEKADHPIGRAAHEHLAPQRTLLGEQLVLDVGADDGDPRRALVLRRREEASGHDVEAHDGAEVGGGPLHLHVGQAAVAPLHRRARHRLRGHTLRPLQ